MFSRHPTMPSFLIGSSGATLAICLADSSQPVQLNLQTYLAAVECRPPPGVGSFNLSTVSLVPYSCAPNSSSASRYSSTPHSEASTVASSLKGKSVSVRPYSCHSESHMVLIRVFIEPRQLCQCYACVPYQCVRPGQPVQRRLPLTCVPLKSLFARQLRS